MNYLNIFILKLYPITPQTSSIPIMNYPIIRYTLLLSVFCLSVCSSLCQTKNTGYPLRNIRLYCSLDMSLLDDTTTSKIFTSEIDVSYYNDYIMLKIPSVSMLTETQVTKQGEFVRERTKIDTLYGYHIYKEGDTKGLLYDSMTATKGTVFPVDSILKMKLFGGTVFFDEKIEEFVSQKLEKDNSDNTITTYVHKDNLLHKTYDSLFVYSAKRLKNIPYSFSALLDHKLDSKVYKVVYFSIKVPKGAQNPGSVHERRNIFGFMPVEPKDPEKTIALFKRYIQRNEGKETGALPGRTP
jgi:hypothetical protein